MALRQCENGHIYDTYQNIECPYCGNGANIINFEAGESYVGKTVAAANIVTPQISEVGATVAPKSYTDRQKSDVGKTVGVFRKKMKLDFVVGRLVCIEGAEKGKDLFSVLNALDESLHERNGMLLCVCDGMGGMKDGKIASETSAAVIRNVFMSLDTASDIPEQLIYGVYRATDSVLSKLDGDGGSTVVECVVIHERLYYVSVGDSYLYLFRGGKLLRINSEHNICHQRYLENIRDGDLDAVECRNDPEAAMLTSFLGMAGELTIDNNADPIPLIKGDVLLVCSDGVCNALSKDELIAALNCDSVYQMCKNIEKAVTDRADPNQDNYTAVILRCV